MEGKNQSFTDLFGAKESPPSSSTGIFATMFPPPSTSDVTRPPTNEPWNPKQARNEKKKKKERVEPCHLSSSLYYGGQDVYSQSSSNQAPASSYPQFKKDGEGDGNGNNSQSASRGNWWQGSLYY